MTYFGFLVIFLLIPIAIFGLLVRRSTAAQPAAFSNYAVGTVIAVHVIIAVIYTTPWDNYLVATRVWWYDPALVTGLTIGWVPIEEYTFFVLQPIMTGLFLVWLMRRLPTAAHPLHPRIRPISFVAFALLWMVMTVLLFVGQDRWNYLSLELSWALIPILLQVAVGADILWRHRKLVLTAIALPTIYLSIADAIAIQSGTWTISPTQSLDWLWFGVLPFEEFVFFVLTNTLVVFGCTLALAAVSRQRLDQLASQLRDRKAI